MAIEKIVFSGMDSTQEMTALSTVFIPIPIGTNPQKIGDYVIQVVNQQSPAMVLPSDTKSALAFVATQGEKEGWHLKRIKLNLRIVEFEWEKK